MNAELFHSAPIKLANNKNKIAVIGGGISSACLIFQLFQQNPNLEITLYCCDDELGSRGSGNQQGAIYPLLQGGQFSVLAELYSECYTYAVNFYKQADQTGINFPHQWCGVLQQAFTPVLVERLTQIANDWPLLGQYISSEKSSEIANLSLPYASLFFKDGGWLAPKQFCQNSMTYLMEHFNLTIFTNTDITKLHQTSQQKWQLENNQQTLTDIFDQVVICTGHLSSQYEQTKQYDIIPIRGQVSHLNHSTKVAPLSTVLCHNGYMTPATEALQCFGATFDRGVDDEVSTAKDNIRNLQQLQDVYLEQDWATQLTENDITGENAAIRATSQDHHPIVGEVMSDHWVDSNVDQNNGLLKRLDKLKLETYPNSDHYGLYIMTGLGARGLTTAPLMAKHLTAIMLNTESPLSPRLIKSVSPMRFQVRELKRNKSIKNKVKP